MTFTDLSNPYENNEPKCRHGINGGLRGGCSECPGGLDAEEETESELIVETISADWKDFSGFIEQLKVQLDSFGLSVIDHPDFEGSDTFGVIISNRPLTAEEIKRQSFREEEEN